MPRFFFNVHGAGVIHHDEMGTECADLDAAIKEAKRALPAIATEEIPHDGDAMNYVVVVTDEDKRAVYTAALSFVGTRLAR